MTCTRRSVVTPISFTPMPMPMTMMMMRNAVRTVTVAVVGALLLGACGGSSPVDSASQTGSGDTVAQGVPGSEEFGLTMVGLARRVDQVETEIGACMAAAGFEYVPVDFDTIRAAQAADQSLPGVSDDDFLAEYGFGLTTLVGQPDTMIELGQGLNGAVIASLSPPDRVAYSRTLLGENVDITFVVGLEDEDFSETGGCTRDAVEMFFTSAEIDGAYVNPGDVVIDNDPRMVAALTAWSTCLADDGYDFGSPDDLDDELVDRLDGIVGDQDPTELVAESADALHELQGFERAVAPVAEGCSDDHIVPIEEQIETELYGAPQG